MSDVWGTAAAFAPLVEVVFLAVAVYFAVGIARRVGTFWAWSVIVIAFVVQGIAALTVSILSISMSPDQRVALGQFVGVGRILGVISSFLFALGMYGLSGIFRRMQDSKRTRSRT